MELSADYFGGKYTTEDLQRILEINSRPKSYIKPFNAFYKKSATEYGPS